MTAEIALLNRVALAFAADSAVTIRMGKSEKIYDSAEKIFEYSREQPIGLMIYNNVEHMGVPLEVLIRKHRSENSAVHATIGDAADTFTKYLQEFPHSVDEERGYLAAVLMDRFTSIYGTVTNAFRASVSAKPATAGKFDFDAELKKVVRQEIETEEGHALDGFLVDLSLDDFVARFGPVIDAVARLVVKVAKPSSELLAAFRLLALAVVKSRRGSNMRTGLVFGGFGSKDLFPTLVYIEADGVYFEKLKVLSRETVDVDRQGARAELVPFAQKEMADRFIYGLDDDFQDAISQFVEGAVGDILKTRPRTFKASERKQIQEAVLENFNLMVDSLREREREGILDILNFMSKKESAEMAHVLVELTSKKRRFSRDQETVGGPIDVAVVTRNEGFIWIRRKHYFEQSENPGYPARVFGEAKEG